MIIVAGAGPLVVVVSARLLALAHLAVVDRLVAPPLFQLLVLVFKLIQMVLQPLLVLQVVLEEDLFFGLGGNERVLDRRRPHRLHHRRLVVLRISVLVLPGLRRVFRALRCPRFGAAHITRLVAVVRRLRLDARRAHIVQRCRVSHSGLVTLRHSRVSTEADGDVAEAEAEHLHVVIVAGECRVRTRRHRVPALAVLVVIEVLAPLNQVVRFVVEIVIVHLLVLRFVERVLVERFKLLLEPRRFYCSLIDCVALLCDQFGIFCVSVELAEPADFAVPSLLGRQLFPVRRDKVERLSLLACLELDFIARCQNLV